MNYAISFSIGIHRPNLLSDFSQYHMVLEREGQPAAEERKVREGVRQSKYHMQEEHG